MLVQTPPRIVVVADPKLTELLAYQASVRAMSSSELVKAQLELARADHAPHNTIRRAMLQATLRTPGDLARAQTLLDSITQKLWPLGGDTIFLPGHGAHSSFAQERRTNPYVSDAALA